MCFNSCHLPLWLVTKSMVFSLVIFVSFLNKLNQKKFQINNNDNNKMIINANIYTANKPNKGNIKNKINIKETNKWRKQKWITWCFFTKSNIFSIFCYFLLYSIIFLSLFPALSFSMSLTFAMILISFLVPWNCTDKF